MSWQNGNCLFTYTTSTFLVLLIAQWEGERKRERVGDRKRVRELWHFKNSQLWLHFCHLLLFAFRLSISTKIVLPAERQFFICIFHWFSIQVSLSLLLSLHSLYRGRASFSFGFLFIEKTITSGSFNKTLLIVTVSAKFHRKAITKHLAPYLC